MHKKLTCAKKQVFSPVLNITSEGTRRFKRRKAHAVPVSMPSCVSQHPYVTLEHLLADGIEGLMTSLHQAGLSAKDLPYFLRNRCIHSLQVFVCLSGMSHSISKCNKTNYAAVCS